MPVLSGCPDPVQLERFALGRLHGPEADALEDHVAHCPHCGTTLTTLPGTDSLVETLMRVRLEDAPCPDLVLLLIRQLKRMCAQTTMSLPAGTPVAEAVALEFLDPVQGEDELGWLGPYRIREMLGAGGMGMVFLADDPRLKRQVALKVIKPELVSRADMKQRFLREAESVAAVEHECIVAIHEVNEHHGVPYLVMPLLRGQSLEECLRRSGGPLSIDETLRIGRQVAEGLAAAHARGLVHRDIKPANIFLCASDPAEMRAGRVKILDFGLAQALDDEASFNQGSIVGTPAFMAPEQAEGLPTDARADLFSLGCVLYRMTTGVPAFDGPDILTILIQAATETPPAPAKVNPGVPADLSRLIVRLLEKKPRNRPASADEVVAALTAMGQRRLSRRRWLYLGGSGVLACGAAAVGFLAAPPRKIAPPWPVEVTLELDGPPTPCVLIRGETETPIDLEAGLHLELTPGEYQLRVADAKALRRVYPDTFVVEPDRNLSVPLRLVGEVRRHADHSGPVYAVAASPRQGEPWILSASHDRTVGVWNAKGTAKAKFFDKHGSPVRAIAFAPNGQSAASGGGHAHRRADLSIRLWDVFTCTETGQLLGHDNWVVALAFAPDGRRLASGSDKVVYVWDLQKRERIHLLSANPGEWVSAVAFSRDGKLLLTNGGGDKILVWDAASGKRVQELSGHTHRVRSIAVSPDGARAVSAGEEGTILLWDLKTWKQETFPGRHGPIEQAAFTSTGERMLTAGADGIVRLWDLNTGTEVYRFAGHKGAVHGVACTAAGRQAVSCGQDGTVRVWEMPR